MLISSASPMGVSAWVVFWVQLPALVLVVAIIIVAIIALRRARREDVPRVFEAFTTSFGRRTTRATTTKEAE